MSEAVVTSRMQLHDGKAWETLAKNILRAEMARHGVTYATLADRLAAIGIRDNELNLRNKISRGRFSAVFLLQCLQALDSEWIQVPALTEVPRKRSSTRAPIRESS